MSEIVLNGVRWASIDNAKAINFADKTINLSAMAIADKPLEFALAIKNEDSCRLCHFEFPSVSITFELDPMPVYLTVRDKQGTARLVITSWGYLQMCILMGLSISEIFPLEDEQS